MKPSKKTVGYDAIAWNVNFSGKLSAKEVCNIQKLSESQLDASIQSSSWRLEESSNKAKFEQYTRITIGLDDASQIFLLSTSANPTTLSSYDIFAARPSTEKMFNACCANIELDIISVDCSQHLPFSMKPSTVQQAIDRGVFFEICYNTLLKDSQAKKHFFNNSLNLIRLTKGKNIIFSSEARSMMQIRGVYDVMNMYVSEQNKAFES